MPSYQVPLQGGGSMTVNASDPQAAQDNVVAQGGTPAGAGVNVGGVQPGEGMGPQNNNPSNNNPLQTIPMTNTAQANYALELALKQANQKYLDGMLKYNNDELAFRQAQEAFNETITQAGLTGTYQGNPTLAAQQYYANTFGTWNTPTAGQQTLASQQQAYNQWLSAQQEARLQQTQQQTTAQNYLTLLSQLRGPADWMQYQKVLGSTPQGMSDLVRAAAGQYIPGGGATTGVQPQAVSLQSMLGGIGQTGQNQQAALNTLVPPNQMAPQTWNNLTPSQQQMLLGAWEAQGYTQDDAKALFTQALPKYATGTPTTGSFKLV